MKNDTLLDQLINEKLKTFRQLRDEIRSLVKLRKEIGEIIEQSNSTSNRNDLQRSVQKDILKTDDK